MEWGRCHENFGTGRQVHEIMILGRSEKKQVRLPFRSWLMILQKEELGCCK